MSGARQPTLLQRLADPTTEWQRVTVNRTDTLSQDRYRAGLAGIKELLKMLAVSQR